MTEEKVLGSSKGENEVDNEVDNSISSSLSIPLEDEQPFPKSGITFAGIQNFIDTCGFDLEGKTTTEVCELAMKPITAQFKSSYCDMMLAQIGQNVIAEANVFVSHAWKYKFLDVVNTLKYYFKEEEQAEPNKIILWFDLFSNNQHLNGFHVTPPFCWWCGTFMEAIKSIGRTVMVPIPWNDPVTLSRAWCLWELYCTSITDCTFEFVIGSEQSEEFVTAFTTDKNMYDEMISKIDVRNSDAYSIADKTRIHEVVQQEIGHDKLNSQVICMLRDWTLHTCEIKYQNLLQLQGLQNTQTLQALFNLACMYYRQQKNNNGLEQFEICYENCVKFCGKSSKLTLTCMMQLGDNLSRRNESIVMGMSLLKECLQLCVDELGEDDILSMECLNNLANFYCTSFYRSAKDDESRYILREKALSLYEKCYNLRMKVYGEKDPQTVSTLIKLADCKMSSGLQADFDTAEKIFELCYEYRKELLGDSHIDTLAVYSELGYCQMTRENYATAEEIFERCLKFRNEKLGEFHRDTLQSMKDVAEAKEGLGKIEEAEDLFKNCLKKRRSILNDDHPEVTVLLKRLKDS